MPTAPRAQPTFALALGGGGARGFAHIHVVRALDELGIRPVAIAGSSIGALVGAVMASGMSGAEIEDYARSILRNRGEVASRLWRARPGSIGEMMQGGLRLAQFNIERIMDVFLPPAIPPRFEDLAIPLRLTATDYYAHSCRVLETGELRSAIAASAAIPAVFRPVTRDGRMLIDGGIYNPVPFDLLDGLADVVIAVDVVGGPVENGARVPGSLELVFGASHLMMQSITELKLRQHSPAILLRPPVSRFKVLDFMKVDEVMAETASVADELKRAVERVLERPPRA